ncbi:cation:proton antiporter [Candidatus Daviesbacteria bacterium]|nr:cation:proton antiporter [Candidatus Daviesbacteria bacterium]
MENIFLQFALVLSLASFFGFVMYRLRLPLVIAYLVSGVTLSGLALVAFQSNPIDLHSLWIFNFLPELGIAFVLFLIGMELDLREIRSLGKPIIMTSLGQTIISTLAGYAIAGYLGFNQVESFYLGIGLAFSSTLVVIKLLLEKRDLTSLYGKLSLGILLLEDLVAILVLMGISVSSSFLHLGLQQSLPLLILVFKALLLFFLTFVLSKYVLEKIFDAVAKNTELLFLTAITWCFLFTTIATLSGFSVVIGAFLAGIGLASSPYHLQIQSKIRPLRDFFVTLFFVYLGTQAKLTDLLSAWPAILAFSAYALFVKPFISLLILGMFGFRKHTMFQTALHLSQISEFSLVILLVGLKIGAVSTVALSVMAAVAVISVIASSVLIAYSRRIYNLLSPLLPFFEHSNKVHFLESKVESEMQDHVVIIGAHRLGGPIVRFLQKWHIPFLVMDFNPHIVEQLREEEMNVVYGDIGDPDVLESLQLNGAKLIISTAIDMEDNEMLLEECRKRKVRGKIVVRALDHEHAAALKTLGADYIILPEIVSGKFLVEQLQQTWPNIHFKGLE